MRDDGLVVERKLPVDPDVDLHRQRPSGKSRHPRRARHWDILASIAVGGGLGTVARYGVGRALPTPPGGFPLSTFAINVSGSFALGFLMVYLLEVWPPRRYLRPFLAVGILGGFTTFSTYTAEIRELFARGSWSLADSYAVDSLLAGLAAVWVGVALARASAGLPVRRGRHRTSAGSASRSPAGRPSPQASPPQGMPRSDPDPDHGGRNSR
jgi:CrcB protein